MKLSDKSRSSAAQPPVIGAATAELFVKEGAKVIVAGSGCRAGQCTRAQAGNQCFPCASATWALCWQPRQLREVHPGEDAATLCAGLLEAFDYFGGVPEHVLFDNAKSVVIDRDVDGERLHRWNDELKELPEACGFTPRLCRPYRAKTKGKVERFNSYLKGSFVVPLAASSRSRSCR